MNKEERIKELEFEISALDAKQLAIKVLINSEYGALANEYFFWADTRNAESITSMGQVAIKWAEREITGFLDKVSPGDKVIYADTDANYITLENLVNKHFGKLNDAQITGALVKFGNEKIQPIINTGYEALAEYLNANEQAMKMKMEVISPTSIWIAKKKYLMSKLYDEGVTFIEPKIKMMGVEAIRSSTPFICRGALKRAIELLLLGSENEVQVFFADFKEKFYSAGINDISFPRSVNGVEKYSDDNTIFKKGTPIAVRGALIFNHFLKERNVSSVESIKSSDKIKFFYIKEPNIYRSNIMAYVNQIPEEFPKYEIDYKTQFQKSFMKPLDNILKIIKWNHEKVNDLNSFFN